MAKEKDNECGKELTVQDFMLPGKVEAFCRTYEYCHDLRCADDLMDDTRLRSYFQAGLCPCGDVLAAYLAELAKQGFVYVTDPDTARCVLPVRLRVLDVCALLGMD